MKIIFPDLGFVFQRREGRWVCHLYLLLECGKDEEIVVVWANRQRGCSCPWQGGDQGALLHGWHDCEYDNVLWNYSTSCVDGGGGGGAMVAVMAIAAKGLMVALQNIP